MQSTNACGCVWLPVVNCATDNASVQTVGSQANIDSGLEYATHTHARTHALARERACLPGARGARITSHTRVRACGLNVVDTAHHRIYGVKHTTCTHSQTLSNPSAVGPSGVLIFGRRK